MTRREQQRVRRLANMIARRSSHLSRRHQKFCALNPVACPAIGFGKTWRFDEQGEIVEDGLSPLALVGAGWWRPAHQERQSYRGEKVRELRACVRVVMESETKSRVFRVRDGVLLMHCQKLVSYASVAHRLIR